MKKLSLTCLSIAAFALFMSFNAVNSFAGVDAAQLFDKHCKICHGEDGTGQTFLGKGLNARNFTDAEWEAKITDEQMIKQIEEGTQNLQPGEEKRMFGFKDKLTPEEIKALVKFVRGFAKK